MTLGTGRADFSKAVAENTGQGPVLPHTHGNDKAGGEGHYRQSGLTLAGHQLPTKPLSHSPSVAGQGEKIQ